MARERRRLLMAPPRLQAAVAARLLLEAPEQHYLQRVLRLRPGDGVELIDGCGGLWQAQLGEGGWLEQLQPVGEQSPPALPQLTLALGLPRRDLELVWRMATELGLDRLQPLQAERSQAGGQVPLQRWRSIVREATEQCERLWLPALAEVLPAQAWLESPHGGPALLATTRRQALPSLEQALQQVSAADALRSDPTAIALAIGPEGGWSPAEEARAEACGWIPVSLGSSILRSSTAAVAAASRLCAWRESRPRNL
ncbi:MAG: 16S rRNA (uracil(1498)-N(3))-methyltransferase [Cyanobium sp.]